jgi:protein-disulfide isomerase
MLNLLLLSAMSLAFLFLGAEIHAQEFSKQALQKLLNENPEIILDLLKKYKLDVLKLTDEAAREARIQSEEQELEEALNNPKQPKITEQTRIRGNKQAKYTLVEYSDFQCAYCGRSFPIVEALRQRYGNDFRFIYKHFPLLDIHPQAMPAARYNEAISLQSQEKAWEFHDILFRNQDKLSEKFYEETSGKLGIDIKRLKRDLKSKKVTAVIEEDIREARELGFSGTPGFVLNGVPIHGAYPIKYFETIIERLEKKKYN